MAANKKSNKAKAQQPAVKAKADVAQKKAKANAPKRSSKNKKPGFFKRVGDFIKSTIAELKKVNWLSSEDLMKSTLVVAAMVGVVTLVVWLMDTGLGAFLSMILKK